MKELIVEKFKKIPKRTKVIGLVCVFLLVGIIGFQIIRNTFANPETGYEVQTVDNLNFTNAQIEKVNDLTRFRVEVTNTLETTYNLKTIEVTFKDEEEQTIETLIGYIGDTLNGNEKKILEAYVDKDITNVSKIGYKINK